MSEAAAFVWKESGQPYDFSACCVSCHYEEEDGIEMPDIEVPLRTPGAYEWHGRAFAHACCGVRELVERGELIPAPAAAEVPHAR